MAEQQTEQDRTEPATPTKLRDAKRRGQVTKSLEVNSLFILSMGVALFYLLGEGMVSRQLALSHELLANAHRIQLDPAQTLSLFEYTVDWIFSIFWPAMAALVIVAILMNMAQTGPVFSFFPLKPDISRINPVNGFKRLFSVRLLFESLKTVIKLLLFAGVLYFAISALLPSLVSLLDRHPDSYPLYLADKANSIALKLLAVLLFIALLDLLYTRWDFAKRMRMSRREIKNEVKRREGDPQIRAKIRELQREAAKRAGSLRKVPDADVLITNPTHLSVALVYQRGMMAAPQVTAKGAGELAWRMREVARLHCVPIVENKALARRLFKSVDIDQPISEELYPLVAKILVRIFAGRNGNTGGTVAG
ncbi:MAG: EscU/YscU/HrcU family type III secretion system export apparatus switch protein [Candidatus Thiodiazotropha sp.]